MSRVHWKEMCRELGITPEQQEFIARWVRLIKLDEEKGLPCKWEYQSVIRQVIKGTAGKMGGRYTFKHRKGQLHVTCTREPYPYNGPGHGAPQ